MQREEKQFESTLETIIQRVNDLKNAIASFIFKIEHEYETLNWPNFLDNYALLSGHLTALSKVLSHDKSPPIRSLTVLPLLLSPERDEALAQLTENRVTTFSHDLVPNYLRTKLEPMAENRMMQLEHKASSLSYENAQKQITLYQKVVSHVWEIILKTREEWDTDSGTRSGNLPTTSIADTHMLAAAVGLGKGLKANMPPNQVGGMPPGGMMNAPQGVRAGNMAQGSVGQQMNANSMTAGGKAPSAIKTNIKPGNQVHPYGR